MLLLFEWSYPAIAWWCLCRGGTLFAIRTWWRIQHFKSVANSSFIVFRITIQPIVSQFSYSVGDLASFIVGGKLYIFSPKIKRSFSCFCILTYSMVQSPSWVANCFAASQEIPLISRNPKVHYSTHNRPPPVFILGQPNPLHIPTSHLLEIHPNIIHPSTPRSPHWSLSLRFPHQDPIHPPLLTHTRHMPSPSHSCFCIDDNNAYIYIYIWKRDHKTFSVHFLRLSATFSYCYFSFNTATCCMLGTSGTASIRI